MRTFDLMDDLEVIMTQYVRAIPEIFMDFDIASVQLVRTDDFGFYDIVSVQDDETEIVVGEVILASDDLIMQVEIFSEEMEADGAVLDY